MNPFVLSNMPQSALTTKLNIENALNILAFWSKKFWRFGFMKSTPGKGSAAVYRQQLDQNAGEVWYLNGHQLSGCHIVK